MEDGEIPDGGPQLRFLSKKERERIRAEEEEQKRRQKVKETILVKEKTEQFWSQLDESRRNQEERLKQIQTDQKDEDKLTKEESQARAEKLELEQLQREYLGVTNDRKKLQKPSEKFRNVFLFEWSPEDDTSKRDYNTIYTSRYEPQLLFGRGFRAGIDVREQRKSNRFYDQLAEKNSSKRRRQEEEEEEYFTVENKPLDRMTERDWRIFREDYQIAIKAGPKPPQPLRHWQDAEKLLSKPIMDAIAACGYETPTPIQMQAIPIGLALMDMIGIAETGSGKTCAFMIPLLMYVSKLPRLDDVTAQRGPYALVLAPARELALQITEEGRKFAKGTGADDPSRRDIRSVPIVGGRNADEQAQILRSGVEVVVATPGRLKDCIERAFTVLTQCNYVVLDEADRMIDMGLEKEVNEILNAIPSTKPEDWHAEDRELLKQQAGHRDVRITHMFTATMPPSVENMAKSYLKSPCIIQIGNPSEHKTRIEQKVERIHPPKKDMRLLDIVRHQLKSGVAGGIIVFVNQKKTADLVAKHLTQNGYSSSSFHGGKPQDVREATLESFRNQEIDILVATDVAGRGLDVQDVQLVVNYDIPADIETYTHRIGRTGRAGKSGLAISFVTDDDPTYLTEPAATPATSQST